MEHNKISELIASKDTVKDKFEIWVKHYDVLQSNGRVFSRNNDNEEVDKIYCNCSNCLKEPNNAKNQELYLSYLNASFDDLKNTIDRATNYSERLNIWIERFGINYCQTYVIEEKEISILPKSTFEIVEYNKIQYELWKEYYFKSTGKNKYSQTDLGSRIERLNKQLKSSPFTEVILENTSKDLIYHYEHKVNDETKLFFQNLIIGKPKTYEDKVWEISELINYIDAHEAYLFLCYLHNRNIMIKDAFLSHTAEVLAETNHGLTWTQIVRYFIEKAVKYNTDIPYSDKNFMNLVDKNGKKLANKRTGFYENLRAFNPNVQFEIINELCDIYESIPGALELKQILVTQYKALRTTSPLESSLEQIDEVKGLLTGFPAAETSYNSGIQKFQDGVYERNAIDDLRLSLELLLKEILGNQKSLENQQPEFKGFLKEKQVAPEIANLLWSNIDNIAKYNNRYVKHNDDVGKVDSEMILDLMTAIIKQIVKVST